MWNLKGTTETEASHSWAHAIQSWLQLRGRKPCVVPNTGLTRAAASSTNSKSIFLYHSCLLNKSAEAFKAKLPDFFTHFESIILLFMNNHNLSVAVWLLNRNLLCAEPVLKSDITWIQLNTQQRRDTKCTPGNRTAYASCPVSHWYTKRISMHNMVWRAG